MLSSNLDERIHIAKKKLKMNWVYTIKGIFSNCIIKCVSTVLAIEINVFDDFMGKKHFVRGRGQPRNGFSYGTMISMIDQELAFFQNK